MSWHARVIDLFSGEHRMVTGRMSRAFHDGVSTLLANQVLPSSPSLTLPPSHLPFSSLPLTLSLSLPPPLSGPVSPQLHHVRLLLTLLSRGHHSSSHLQTAALSRRRDHAIFPLSGGSGDCRDLPPDHSGDRHTSEPTTDTGKLLYMYICSVSKMDTCPILRLVGYLSDIYNVSCFGMSDCIIGQPILKLSNPLSVPIVMALWSPSLFHAGDHCRPGSAESLRGRGQGSPAEKPARTNRPHAVLQYVHVHVHVHDMLLQSCQSVPNHCMRYCSACNSG